MRTSKERGKNSPRRAASGPASLAARQSARLRSAFAPVRPALATCGRASGDEQPCSSRRCDSHMGSASVIGWPISAAIQTGRLVTVAESGASWPLHHFPDGGGSRPKSPVRRDPASDRRAAAGPFAAMTGLDPEAFRSPDRTRACCAGRGTPLQREIVTGPGFRSPNDPDEDGDRNVPYQIRTGFAVERPLCYRRRQPAEVIREMSV